MPISRHKNYLPQSLLTIDVQLSTKYYYKACKEERKKMTHYKEAKQLTDMIQILELSAREIKESMINMLKDLVQKVASLHDQMGNFSRDMETLRKNQMEMLKLENMVT